MGALLQVSGLSRSTYYYQCSLQLAGCESDPLKQQISTIYHRHKGRYGYRRITAELRQQWGQVVNHKKVQRLMQALGLKSLVRPKRYRSWRGPSHVAVANVLQRSFQAQQPHQKWVTDVTEFKVKGDKLYLSPVMDLYNGEIVAWRTSRQPVFSLVGEMLQDALGQLTGKTRPMLHSDQGWQYQMPAYRAALREHGVMQSMSRRGNCLDNAAMESFFGTLKAEFFHLNRFDSVQELEAGLKEYIHYYNHERIRLKLKGLSPVQYRVQSFGGLTARS